MAWRCSGSTNSQLIANMQKAGIITDTVATAMSKVDRANYVRNASKAYEDSPQGIGYGATISAPHMHAYAAEQLLSHIHPGSKVLDVGSGSGYLSAVFYQLGASKVVGLEHIPELVVWACENIKRDGLGDALETGNIEIIEGDGRLGYSCGGPYNAIHVGASAPEMPTTLIEQLACPGRMFIPVGKEQDLQYIWHVDKDAQGNVTQTKVMGVRYVPLTDRPAV